MPAASIHVVGPWAVAALKSTIAVLAAWILADKVIGSPQSFLAPYTALFMIGATVRASFPAALRQVGVVAAGVAIAAAAALTLPPTPAIAASVAVGTLVGRIRIFSPDGMWVAITALLVLLYGTATDQTVVFARIADVALGAAVGAVINAVIIPPEYLSQARDLIAERSRGQAALLSRLAGVVRTGEGDSAGVRSDLWELHKALGAGEALDRGQDSLRANIRNRSWVRVGGGEIYRGAATTLDRVLLALGALGIGVETLVHIPIEDADGMKDLRTDVADLLDILAHAVHQLQYDPARHSKPYARILDAELPKAMRLAGLVHDGIDSSVNRSGSGQREALSAIVIAVDSIVSALDGLRVNR